MGLDNYAVAAFEIVGSRIKDWNINIFDTIADNASSGKYVLGNEKKKLGDFDLLDCKMTLLENKSVVLAGVGAACLGNPLNAAHWLASIMARSGRPLQSGDIILSGALGPFAPVKAGKTYDLEIEDLGAVRVSFT